MSLKKALEYAIKTLNNEFATYSRVKQDAVIKINEIAKRKDFHTEKACPVCGDYHCGCYFMKKPQWFSTSKPLPDGDYGWRRNKGDKPNIYKVAKDKVSCWDHYFDEPAKNWIGEWFKIEFPE